VNKKEAILCPSENPELPVARKEDPPQRHGEASEEESSFFFLLRASVSLW
jgi:hypothetical protein